MTSHFDRSAKNISNENINESKTNLNYNLADQSMQQIDFINKRCSEVKCQNRKDVNVMCSWVVTAPKDLSENELEPFFKATYEFLEKKYKKENVISAYVHMDEVTPHLHFAFVPVVKSLKKGKEIEKVSAKELINRQELKLFHGALEKHIELSLGHEVNLLNQATKEGNKSIELLKRESAIKAKEELNLIKNSIGTLQFRFENKSKELLEIDNKITEQKKELAELTTKAESKMNDFNAITKDYNERSEIIKNNYEKANIVLDKQAAEIKNRTERIAALKETEKAQQETFDFNSKRITEQTEKIRKNKEIISKQIEGFNKTNEIFTKNKEVIKNQSLKIENQAIEIKKGEHAIESMRAIGKSVRDDLERTVSDFNNQDKQVLNRAVEFIKTLPSEIQERWSRFNVERKRTPSAWAKKLANEKKNGLER